MLKLYLRERGRVTAYHEAWIQGSKITEHWGVIGERGSTREHRVNSRLTPEENLERILAKARAAGYEAIASEDHITLIIEFELDGWGDSADLAKRHELENRMNETLGWTGLGHCDGGSIGSGTMECCCLVVDFEIARRVIAADLRDSEYSDYSRIDVEAAD